MSELPQNNQETHARTVAWLRSERVAADKPDPGQDESVQAREMTQRMFRIASSAGSAAIRRANSE